MADTLDIRRAVMRCGECAQRFGPEAMFCPFDGAKLEPAAWDPAGDPLLRRVIDGRYEVVGVLGEGGMGTVYQVRHTALDRLFAMKVLRRDLANDPDLAARFMREARATASVKHPNIVAINDFGRLDVGGLQVPYFVMENLVGQTLAQAIKAGGALPAALGARIVMRVAGALAAAHAEKIVHRDLKPDNVFLLGSAGGGADAVDVRVVDFGAALILGASRVTKAGIVFGTPHYMSPEQASGQPVDHRADIYALGVIMYEMFTGRVPFVADTYMGVLTQHMFVKPVPPSQISDGGRAAPSLGALEGVILRALEKKPEHRHATMEELAAEIDRVTTFQPDGFLRVASAPSAPSAPSGLAPPSQTSAFALAGSVALPAGVSASSSTGTRPSTRLRRARARTWVTYGGIALGVAAATLAAVRVFRSAGRAAQGAPAIPVSSAASARGPSPSQVAAPAPPVPAAAATSAASSPSAVPPILPAVSPAPSVASARGPRSSRPPGSPPKKTAASAPAAGDFADPWAK